MPKALNLLGQTFGKLKVIEKLPSKSGKTYWLCECECGNKTEVQTCHLRNGSISSCGCQKKVGHKQPIKELGIRKCLLCNKDFIPNSYNRQYCYDCSPSGISRADTIRYKKRMVKHLLIQYKGGKCEKCGYDKCEGAFHFHHIDPSEKEFNLSHVNLSSNFNMQKFYEEVDKCELLCANCHAEEHYIIE